MPAQRDVDDASRDHERNLIRAARLTAQEISPTEDIHARDVRFAAPPAMLLGDSFPGYEIEREIHRGGQGVVYLARQQATRRLVAIKITRDGPFSRPGDKARFDREVRILAQLKHPNIVSIHDCGEASGSQYFVMDYIQGRRLDAYAFGSELPVESKLRLFVKVCDAVSAAHLRGVIHRDLKPGNILVDERGEPQVLDFGLAKLADNLADHAEEHMTMTQTGQFIGSLPWSSPEQAQGAHERLDVRSDVYSLGVLLYQMLTRRFPYPVRGPMRDVLNHILDTPPTRLSQWQPGIDRDVETIVLKCLEKEPDRRYQGAAVLADDIRRFLHHEPILARQSSTVYQLRKWVARHRVPSAMIAALVITILGSAVFLGIGYRVAQRLRAEAETARDAEAKQRRIAERRADETRRVAEFQAGMLDQIRPTQAGILLMNDIRDRFAEALDRSGVSEAARTERVDRFAADISRVNATDAAVEMIDRTILKPAIAAVETGFGDQPAVDAALRQTLADLYTTLGRYDEALPLQEQALATRRRLLGNEHVDTLISINNTALLLNAQGKMEEAEAHYREALDKYRRLHGEEHVETLRTINNLGFLLQSRGKLDEAEPYYREGLTKRRQVLGDEHPETLVSLNNMGFLLQAQGRLAEAEPYYRQALEKRRRILGNDHPDTLNSIGNMGSLLRDLGRMEEAEPYYYEALDQLRQMVGEEHPDTIRAINNLGFLLQEQGKLDQAELLYHEALEKYRHVLGEQHPDTLRSLSNLGYVLQAQHELDEAEVYYCAALEGRRRVLGEDHPDTLASLGNLGGLFRLQGKLALAEQFHREALEGMRRVLGDEHPDTLTVMSNMGPLLRAQGKLGEAELYYREALKQSRRVRGEEHPDTLVAINNVGFLLRSQGKLEEAEIYYREALEKRRRLLGEEHPDTLISVNNTGALLRSQGRFSEAEALLTPAVTLAEATLSEQHSVRGALTRSMVRLYEGWQKAEPGAEIDEKLFEWQAQLKSWQATTQPATLADPAGRGGGHL
jgi:non-specific serine/threonine protein kinase/serine/threonine-protein kinase